jgi:mono/diheme cytochrome c family protein
MSKKWFVLLIAAALALVSLASCGQGVQPAGLTPIPTLGPTAVLAPFDQGTPVSTTAPETGQATPSGTETEVAFEPPKCDKANCEEPGPAITQNLQGNATAGQQVFVQNCAVCHGQDGKGGVANPGSEDGTIPSLSPIDEMFSTDNAAEFAKQLDLYLEHGSKTGGKEDMPDWGDTGKLQPQQIADLIAYLISLNPH